MIIKARAPLRLGLAGGGTDVSPFSDVYGGNVLNVTIDKYAYAILQELKGSNIVFESIDLEKYVLINLVDKKKKNSDLKLHQAVYFYIMKKYNNNKLIPIELKTFCEVPAGSGLGSSSTLVVAMIKVFAEFLNLPLTVYDIAKDAYYIERILCGYGGGKQDQYAATFGGFNFMEFYKDDQVVVNPLTIKPWISRELESSILLYFSGVSRSSEDIIYEQSSNTSQGLQKTLSAMHAMKKEAQITKECLLTGNFQGIYDSLKMGWKNKKKSALSVSNNHIDEILDLGLSTGAHAGKVSGAGGGGYVMFFVPVDKRSKVINSIQKLGGEFLTCAFTNEGCQAWRIK
jgi:D-glycero-alpha-D-manno-heptose-7-phosphate kinase